MKIKFLTIIAGLLMTATMITSCLDSNDTVYDYSSDASITAFSINNIITSYTEKVNGKDTTLTTTVEGSDYPFVIDQSKRLIYNVDSLPVGTDVSKVVVNITADTPYIFIAAEEKDSLWVEEDSLNFTKPIHFKVMALDMSYGDRYRVEVNVHQVYPDSMMWTQMKNCNFNGKEIEAQKAVCFNHKLYVFAEHATQVQVTTTNIADGNNWSDLVPLNIPEKADYSSVMAWGDHLYILANNQLYCSTDGTTWNKVEAAPALSLLVANIYSTNNSENNKIVAIDKTGEYFIESDKNGTTWTQQGKVPTSSDAPQFPLKNLSYASYPLSTYPNIDRMVVIGDETNASASDSVAVVWSKLSTESSWGDYGYTEKPDKFCPKLENIAMIHYNDRLYAFGGNGKKDGKEIAAFSIFYESSNNGATWIPVEEDVSFPNSESVSFTDLYEQANGHFSYAVDEDNHLWIMWSKTGEVWRGRIGKLAFEK